METQSKEGMMTMEQHLLHLYQHNVIYKESAITYTNEASLFERLDKFKFNYEYFKVSISSLYFQLHRNL